MVLDLKALKDILEREVVDVYDHRLLNREVAPFDRVVPTAETSPSTSGIASQPHFERTARRLHGVRVYETPDLYVDYFGERGVMLVDAQVPLFGFAPAARAAAWATRRTASCTASAIIPSGTGTTTRST